MAVNKISEQEKTLIRNDSVLSLPDRPSEKGYTAQQLKEYFTNIVLGENGVITELDRIVEEINAFIGDIGDENVKNYILDSIINKFVEQAPYISLSFEDNKLKYTKFGTPNITGELDIIPSNSVFNTQSTLTSKNGETIYPKTTLDNLIDTLDDKSVKEYILNLNTRINELLSKHNTEISELNSNIEAIIGGDAPEALDTIRELAEALKNNPSQIDDILQQISNLSSGKVDKVAGKELTTNDYTNADKSFVSELKSKNLATMSDIPTDLSSFNEDSNHRLTTDTEKGYWNSKANGVHTHEINDINGLQTALDDKSNKGHTHTLEQLNAEEKGVASSLVTEHNNDTEAHSDIRTKLNEVENKVNGINSAISFENQLQLTDWLGGTYSRVDGKLPSDLFIGQHIYLKDQNDNDYWVSTLPVSNIGDLSILETDKIDLTDYVLSSDLGAVATSNNYSDLNNLPNIPNSLSELSEDDNHKTITASKLAQIDSNTTAINSKLDKNLGSGNSNMGLITDDNGDIVTAPIGSTAFLIDNLESTATNLAPTANQVRILNNNKLDKQQGVENKGKILSVDNNGLITTIDNVTVPTKVSELQNDSDYATKSYVDTNGGKIDSISVNGVTQTITNKNVDIEIPTKTSDLTNDSNYATTTEVNNVRNEIPKSVDGMSGGTISSAVTVNGNIKGNYVEGSWLRSTSIGEIGDSDTYSRFFVNKDGWLYTRTKTGVKKDLGVTDIEGKIPNQASETNQLADKEFVNSSISTNTADFKGTVNSTNELPTTNVNINDYAFVITTDSNGNTLYNRYKYNTSNTWEFEYALNNSSFTASQWSAINSGATTTNIAQIATNTSVISDLQSNKEDKSNLKALAYKDSLSKSDVGLGNVDNTSDLNKPISTAVQNALDAKANVSDIPTQQEKEFLTSEYEKSKNLFYMSKAYSSSVSGASVTANGDFIEVNVTAGNALLERRVCDTKISLKANRTYTITIRDESGNLTALGENFTGAIWFTKAINTIYDNEGLQFDKYTSTLKYTPTSDVTLYGIGLNVGAGFTQNYQIKLTFQIEEGTTVTEYHSYNGPIVHEKDLGELLWQNASPNADFASQTITLSKSLSNYSKIRVGYKKWKSEANALTFQEFNIEIDRYAYITNGGVTANCETCYRQINLANTQIDFGTGYVAITPIGTGVTTTLKESAGSAVPVAIYGIK